MAGAVLAGVATAFAPPGRAAAFTSSRIVVTTRGTGPDVLLIPGLSSGPAAWNAVADRLMGFRLHLVHVRGFAGLPAAANANGPLVRPLAQEIGRYIAAQGLKRPAVVGHSMGGTLAMLIGLAGAAGRVMVVDMLPAGAAMVGGTASGLGFLADQLSGYLTGTAAGRRYLAQMVARTPGAQGSDPDVIAGALRDLANIDLGPQLSRLSVPLEVVYAIGEDAQMNTAITARFRSAYASRKGVALRPLGPSSHMVMRDQPARFTALLKEFLTG